jgi:hypothetical protein
VHLADGLASCLSMQHVNLSGNVIRDVGTAAAGRALQSLFYRALTWLNLSDCRISSKGCKALCRGLKAITSLTNLMLGVCVSLSLCGTLS